MRRAFMLFGILIFSSQSPVWAGGPGTTNANFLKAGQGVRPIGMGETYIALGHGLDTLYWNPAGLSQLTAPTASFNHSFWFQDIGTEYLAFGMPLGPLGAAGGGVTVLHTGAIEQTLEDSFGNYAGTGSQVSAMSLALLGCYSQKLSRLFPVSSPFLQNILVGASLRVVTESVSDVSIFGGGLDVGAIWRETEDLAANQGLTDPGKPLVRDRGWRVGLVAQNLGATTDNLLPINFRLGGGYVVQELFSEYGRGTVALDLQAPIDNDIKISLGAEYAQVSPHTEFALRFGYKAGSEIRDLDSMAGMTGGLGFAILAGLVRYQVDYAFVPYGELGATHRAALTVAFLPGENVVSLADSLSQIKTKPVPPVVVASEKSNPKPAKANAEADGAAPTQAIPDTSIAGAASAVADAAPALTNVEECKTALDRLQNRIKSGMFTGINFKRGESQYLPESKTMLNQAGAVIEKYPAAAITVIGYDADKKIAEERAKNVIKYFTMMYRIRSERLKSQAGELAQQPKNTMIGFKVDEIGR